MFVLNVVGKGASPELFKDGAAPADAVIRHNDLRALLYLQGYREEEIVRINRA